MNLFRGRRDVEGKKIHYIIALFVFLSSLYCLTYSGRFSTDDEHILASRSLSFAFHGSFDTSQVLGNTRIYTYSNLPAEQASQSLEIEPFQAVLGAGLVHLAQPMNNGFIQMLFLLNIFTSVLTAICVFISVCALGYSYRTALVTSILFALGTQIWPYSRTFFRDPLAMLCLSFTWYCVIIINTSSSSLKKRWAAIGAVIGFILGILAKNTVLIASPVLFVLFLPLIKTTLRSQKIKIWFTSPRTIILLMILFIGALLFLVTAQGPLSRFNIKYYWQLLVFFITSPHPHFLEAFFGPLFSPGKSLFLFSPIIILSLVSLYKRHRESVAAWIYVVLLIVFQALFYDALWWGSINWGLRFLLPAIPLLMIGISPIIDKLINSLTGRIGIAVLSLFSISIQIVGLSAPLVEYYKALQNISPSEMTVLTIWNPVYSAIIWNIKWILTGNSWDLAIIRENDSGFVPFLLFVCLGGLAYLSLLVRRTWFSTILAGGMIIAILILPSFFTQDPVYWGNRYDLKTAQRYLDEKALDDDALVVSNYGSPAWYFWMNWGNQRQTWISLPYSLSLSSIIPPFTEDILMKTAISYEYVWLLLPCDSPSSVSLLENKYEIPGLQFLTQYAFTDGECTTDLLLFQSNH